MLYPVKYGGKNFGFAANNCDPCEGDPEALAATQWFIDPQNVSGTASDGPAAWGHTATTPLLSWAELQRRIGQRPIYYHDARITYLSNWPATDLPRTSFDVAPGFVVTIDGKAVGSGKPGPISLKLYEALARRLAAVADAPAPAAAIA
jgi:hypothetical protein